MPMPKISLLDRNKKKSIFPQQRCLLKSYYLKYVYLPIVWNVFLKKSGQVEDKEEMAGFQKKKLSIAAE